MVVTHGANGCDSKARFLGDFDCSDRIVAERSTSRTLPAPQQVDSCVDRRMYRSPPPQINAGAGSGAFFRHCSLFLVCKLIRPSIRAESCFGECPLPDFATICGTTRASASRNEPNSHTSKRHQRDVAKPMEFQRTKSLVSCPNLCKQAGPVSRWMIVSPDFWSSTR